MEYRHLAWAAVCYYYRSSADKKYLEILSDTSFLERLRADPGSIGGKEFEEKAILGYLKIENYDLLIRHQLANTILHRVVELQPLLSRIQDQTIVSADLATDYPDSIGGLADRLYHEFCAINGLWSTGASKILHLMNVRLFPLVTSHIMDYLRMPSQWFTMSRIMRHIQHEAREATEDFKQKAIDRPLEDYLSDKMGYSQRGCPKSMVKFIDEYYWLVSEGLPIPPPWAPEE